MPNTLPLHPALVHFPIAIAVLIPLLAIATLFFIQKKMISTEIWLGILVIQALLVTSGFLSMQTGHEDEEIVEETIKHSLIHQHEEAAEAMTYTATGILLIGLAAYFLSKKIPFKIGASITIAGMFVVTAMALNTGKKGGELVYKYGAAEAHRKNNANIDSTESSQPAMDSTESEEEHDHDDH